MHETGRRQVIGIDVGEAKTEAFWRAFLRSLRACGLAWPAYSSASPTPTRVYGARSPRFSATPWQRCTVRFLRDMHGHCGKVQQPMIYSAARESFAAEDASEAGERLAGAATALEHTARKVARLPHQAEDERLAFMAVANYDWSMLRSTNPLERVNREIGRRSDVVGIYPNDAALMRLTGRC